MDFLLPLKALLLYTKVSIVYAIKNNEDAFKKYANRFSLLLPIFERTTREFQVAIAFINARER